MKVYLDDERPTPPGWTRAYTSHEAIALLSTGQVTIISLDHDLGPPEAGTGYDVCLWLEEQVILNGFTPPEVRIHSANPVGRQRMQNAVKALLQ
jgi:hypothetical protein